MARSADVPTMDEFNALKAQVQDHEARITNLENGNPQPITPSPDGTQVTDTQGQIIDAQGRTFRLVESVTQGHRIDMDGVISGSQVVRLYADSGLCYQENVDGDWWYMDATDWIASTDPTGEAPPQPEPQPPSDLLFSDEFTSELSLWNSYAPDNSKTWQLSRWYGNDWNGWVCNEGWMINPFNPATPKSDMYRLDNGNLILDVQRTPSNMLGACGNKKYITAQVNSLNFKKKGGYWEARIKCPFIPGTNMAFWLMNNKTWPPEVDIAELVNGGSWTVMSQGIWNTHELSNNHFQIYSDQGFDIEAWHTYGFWWDAANKRMQMFYDGQKTMEQDEPSGYDEPMFVICGSQSGGDWSGPIPDDATMGPLLFDYVRCYEQPPSDAVTMELTRIGTRSSGRLRGKKAPGPARGKPPGRMRDEQC